MIFVETTGGLKKDRELAEEVMWFCIETLMPRMKNLGVECEITNKLESDVLGYAWCVEDNRDCVIQIDNRLSRDVSRDKFIETVCHEMVHVWQIATNRTKETYRDGHKQLWKCKDGKYRNYGKTAYERQPWETEAYALEGRLAELFKEYEKNC